MKIVRIYSEKYNTETPDYGDGDLESYTSALRDDGTYYVTDTAHDDCDLDIQRNRIVITNLKQLDALQRAIDAVRKDMLMSVMQEESQTRGEY